MITLFLKILDSKNWIFLLMNKFIFFIVLFINYNSSAFANPNTQARTAILVDYHSNEVLYELDSDMQIYPASMTKIMTAIVAFDLLEKNKISLDDKFTISDKDYKIYDVCTIKTV